MDKSLLRVGCAAGFSGDRTDAAAPVVEALVAAGGPAVLIFETLAERTLALAQLERRGRPDAGYEPLLDELLRPVLARCLGAGVRIVSNFGAANPVGAARRILALARELGLPPPRVAVVEGDDLSGAAQRPLWQRAAAGLAVVSANAYLGAQAIAGALRDGADIVVCGRVADPSLVVGPALAHFGWAADDWDRLARATMAGHLLECGAQVSGGYYADPGVKDVPGLAQLGYPIAEIDADGHCAITKPPGTGGRIDAHTVKEQLLYEVHDPSAYLTPDVVADIGEAEVAELGPDRVRLTGVRGHPRPETLKVNICHETGWLAEGEISYAGARAEARARLAADVLRERLRDLGPLRADLVGVASVFGDDAGRWLAAAEARAAGDVRLRVALSHAEKACAERLPREVTALYTCGPAGGGGVRTALRARLGTVSCLVPREQVPAPSRCSIDGCPGIHHDHGAAVARSARPHRRQGQPIEHQRHRLASGAVAAARRAGHRSRRDAPLRAPPAVRGDTPPAAEAARDELRHRRRARRRRQRLPQPRQPRQGAVLPAARPAASGAGCPAAAAARTGHATFDKPRRPPMTSLARRMLLCAAALALGPAASAQPYPARPITFVVPFAAGSATDQLARALGQSVTEQTKQAVVVDNKAGASGMLAAQQAARAAADGYTVLITTNTTHAANEHLYKKLPYHPVKDFAPVTGLGKGGQVLVVNTTSPYKSVADVLAAARKSPGKLSFGSGSSSSRVAGEMLKQLAGVDLLHVPYKSNPLAITDLLGGQIDLMITDTATGVPQVKAGKLRALGVSTSKRLPML
ncbi:MAG: acyclic terpene utilization AtuA family protein, partial [Rubrivivax sp.]|nr:acyclic terpene utilization AtuA family protein [Rubrivivax sp.]